VRATGCGVASAIGRLGAIASPIVVGYIYPIYRFAGVFGITTAVLLAGALSVLILGIATSGHSLEAITEAEGRSPAGAASGKSRPWSLFGNFSPCAWFLCVPFRPASHGNAAPLKPNDAPHQPHAGVPSGRHTPYIASPPTESLG